MCAMPVWMFFLTLRLVCRFGCAMPWFPALLKVLSARDYFLVAAPCFLTA